MSPFHVPQHKKPQTLEEAITRDQQQKDRWYLEWLEQVRKYHEQESKK